MAVSTVSGPIGLFDADVRDKWSIAQVLKLAMFGHSQKFPSGTALASGVAAVTTDQQKKQRQLRTARAMLAHSMGRRAWDFRGVFQTSNADALASAFDLSAQSSVTFPANTVREVELYMRSFNDADDFIQRIVQPVYGNDGVTPVLGDPRLVDAFMLDDGVYKQMGMVYFSTDEAAAEKTDGSNSSGTALGAFSSSVAPLTFPPGRMYRGLNVHYAPDEYTGAIDDVGVVIPQDAEGHAIDGTFDLVGVAIDDGTEGGAAFNAGLIAGNMELWPPSQIQLVLNSNAVEVHLHSAINDVFEHELALYLGPAAPRTLLAT